MPFLIKKVQFFRKCLNVTEKYEKLLKGFIKQLKQFQEVLPRKIKFYSIFAKIQ